VQSALLVQRCAISVTSKGAPGNDRTPRPHHFLDDIKLCLFELAGLTCALALTDQAEGQKGQIGNAKTVLIDRVAELTDTLASRVDDFTTKAGHARATSGEAKAAGLVHVPAMGVAVDQARIDHLTHYWESSRRLGQMINL
jgi:hypothetical protein